MAQYRQRGNPNWCRPGAMTVPAAEKTSFELLLEKFGFDEEQEREIIAHRIIREWARRHCNQRYIPEHFLDAWGLDVETKLT